jgi:uncharacterized protein
MLKSLFTPTMLKNYLSCSYIVHNEKYHEKLGIVRKERTISNTALLAKGNEHEKIVFAELKKQYKNIADLKPKDIKRIDKKERVKETLDAMKDGVDLIYGGYLEYDEWGGEFDFLVKNKNLKTEFGDYGYDVVDAKNTSKTKADHIIQLGMYALILNFHQKKYPEHIGVALKKNVRETFRTKEILEFFIKNKNKYENFLDKEIDNAKPEKCSFCDFCDWTEECEKIWEKEDNVNQVAGLSRLHARKFNDIGVKTFTELAKLDPNKNYKEFKLETSSKLIKQAKLQYDFKITGIRKVEIIDQKKNLLTGFNLLPKPDAGDVMFDMESVPDYIYPEGLEYLFGVSYEENGKFIYKAFWAHNRQEEKQALIDFFDFLKKHFVKFPNAYIYHYANYELAALNRLTSNHNILNKEFDDYLRAEKFVDLYKVVKQGIMISESSYSLKYVEKFYDFVRTGDVKKAGESVDMYAEWMDTGNKKYIDDIELYNKEDVESTLKLRNWLVSIRPEDAIWYEGQPKKERDEDEEGQEESKKKKRNFEIEFLEYQEKLQEEKKISPDVVTLLSNLIGFYRREARPEWRLFFDRKTMSHDELIEDSDCIGDMKKIAEPFKEKRSMVYTYEYPEQDFKLKLGDKVLIANEIYFGQKDNAGTIFELDNKRRIVKLKKSGDPLPDNISISKGKPRDTSLFESNVLQVIDCIIAKDNTYKAIVEILKRDIPDIKGVKKGEAIIKKGDFLIEIPKLLLNLNNSYLVLQGPPGTGKTYYSANAIIELLMAGKKIAINANSHKVINNLLARVEEMAEKKGFELQGIKKSTFAEEDTLLKGKYIRDVEKEEEFIKALNTKSGYLFAGTKWNLCREYYNKKIDYLFVDEAGQITLSDLVAMSPACKNIVLIGDQMQLGHPSKGVHPGDSGKSILDFLLENEDTIPEERGIFLNKTHRLHPHINKFISDNFYDSRLITDEKNELRKIKLKNAYFKNAGIYYVPVIHDNNSQKSEEECEMVKKLIKEFLGAEFTDKDGSTREITLQDILIISPFNVQVNYLKSELPDEAQVGTIDKFQGQEAPITIISMTSSDSDNIPRDREFFFNRNRLNVAISRSQLISVILFNPKLLNTSPKNINEIKLINNFYKLEKFETVMN